MKVRLYKRKQSKGGQWTIEVSVSWEGQRVQTSIGVPLTAEEWDQVEKQLQGGRGKLSPAAQLVVDRYRAIETETYRVKTGVDNGFIERGKVDILQLINAAKGAKAAPTATPSEELRGIYAAFMEDTRKQKNLSEGYQENQQRTLRLLTSYNKPLAELSTAEGFGQFSYYLQHTKKLNNTTARCYIGMVRTFLKWCYKHGNCSNGFDLYETQLKTPDTAERAVIYLTFEELKRIEQLELKGIADDVRDILLFQCFTGLRVSDVRLLTWANIQGDTMRLTTKKTAKAITKKLPKQAIAILSKRKGMQTRTGAIFPTYCDRTTQRNLQNIGKLAGLTETITLTIYRDGQRTTKNVQKWEVLTTHVGRKTFVVLSLSMGFTANQVIKETGHATIRTLQPYIDIADTTSAEIADKWSKLKD